MWIMNKKERLVLRKVVEDDANFLWLLANDPDVREASFSTAAIPWENHIKWLRARLNDPLCVFFIALNQDTAVGQVRFYIEKEEAIISISIKKEYRHRNYGTQLIKMSSDTVFKITQVLKIHAYVKVNNKPSISAFLKASFMPLGRVNIQGHEAIHLIKERVK